MTESAAEVSISIDASPNEVWHALTDPELIRRYFMGAEVASDWNVGSSITWSGTWSEKPYEDKGEIIHADEEQRLTFSHWSPMSGTEDAPENYHVVDITITSTSDGTNVTLTQSSLVGGLTDSDRANKADFEKNWLSVLKGLKQTIEG